MNWVVKWGEEFEKRVELQQTLRELLNCYDHAEISDFVNVDSKLNKLVQSIKDNLKESS